VTNKNVSKTEEKPVPDVPKTRRSALSLELKHTLSQGDLGGQVKAAQEALIKHGFSEFKNDGRYGSMMGKAVRKFQDSRGLRITGEINATTWENLFEKTTEKLTGEEK
jgi:peptidoglycan hydrolase-like protein with peptidoglycan-binding domain